MRSTPKIYLYTHAHSHIHTVVCLWIFDRQSSADKLAVCKFSQPSGVHIACMEFSFSQNSYICMPLVLCLHYYLYIFIISKCELIILMIYGNIFQVLAGGKIKFLFMVKCKSKQIIKLVWKCNNVWWMKGKQNYENLLYL